MTSAADALAEFSALAAEHRCDLHGEPIMIGGTLVRASLSLAAPQLELGAGGYSNTGSILTVHVPVGALAEGAPAVGTVVIVVRTALQYIVKNVRPELSGALCAEIVFEAHQK
jgi:hypothetical protein